MSWLDRFFGKEKKSAELAKNRLMVAIATDRRANIENLDRLKADIIEVLKRYITFEDIEIKKENRGDVDILEIDVVMQK